MKCSREITNGSLYLGKSLEDIQVAWIEDDTKRAVRATIDTTGRAKESKYLDWERLLREYKRSYLGNEIINHVDFGDYLGTMTDRDAR